MALVTVQPIGGAFQRHGFEVATLTSTDFLANQQSSIFENAQVFGNGWERNREGFGQFGHSRITARQSFENGASGRIRQRAKRSIQRIHGIFNHKVKYKTPKEKVKENFNAFVIPPIWRKM